MASSVRQAVKLLAVRSALRQAPGARGFSRGPVLERSIFRDVERMINNVYRDVESSLFPYSRTGLPIRALPHATLGEDRKPAYRLNIDMSGFKPEDIKIQLKNRVLSINATMDVKSDDGGRFYQEVTRDYLLPESVKVDELKSLLTDDGILCIEAPLPEPEKPKEIPIERGGEQPKQQERLP